MRILTMIFAFTFFATPAFAEFIGELVLKPDGCELTSVCKLGEDFGFIDSRGVGWQANEGAKTDGATIPRWGQFFVGIPFTEEYLPAAVLHDQYSKSVRPVRGWFETQRMFYEALRANGVDQIRSSLLFAGVLAGSGKWITRMTGQPCQTGATCLQQTVKISLERQPETYDTKAFREVFERIRKQIEAGEVLGISEVERLVRSVMDNDIYLRHPTGVIKSGIAFGALHK